MFKSKNEMINRIRLTRSRSNCDVMKHKVMEVIVQRLKDIDVDMNHKENVIDI